MRGHAAVRNSHGYGAHLYIPWWSDRHNELDFPLGYHVEVGGGGFAHAGARLRRGGLQRKPRATACR